MGVAAFFDRQVSEIATDRVLRIYGAVLSASHLLTLAWWLYDGTDELFADGREHICWPILEACHHFPYPGRDAVQALLVLYGVLGAAATALFVLRRETVRVAYAGLAVLTVAKLLLMALDFRTRMNQHYMIFFTTLPFLVLPGKRATLRLLIPFFYFWAGTLKLNREWLSGSAIYGRIWPFDDRTLPWACGYVLFLELVVVWWLWARSRWLFWSALAQLFLFHALSYSVVNFFYPILMLGLLSLFPLCRLMGGESGPLFSKAGVAWVAAFSVLQLMPYLFPGDTALTGEGRLFALHMFDAKIECRSHAIVRRADRPPEAVDLFMPLVPRIQCDPIVYLSRGKILCDRLRHTPGFVDLDLKLESKRTTDAQPVPVIDVPGFCARWPTYSLLRPNDWIRH
jgi:hypothetical protein